MKNEIKISLKDLLGLVDIDSLSHFLSEKMIESMTDLHLFNKQYYEIF